MADKNYSENNPATTVALNLLLRAYRSNSIEIYTNYVDHMGNHNQILIVVIKLDQLLWT